MMNIAAHVHRCPHDNAICIQACPIMNRDASGDYLCVRQAQGISTSQGLSDFSPDAPMTVNELGGKQSKIHARLDLLDPDAIMLLGHILADGAEKYGEGNWQKIQARDHVNHALVHLIGWLADDKSDDHLGHAFCRLMMACATEEK